MEEDTTLDAFVQLLYREMPAQEVADITRTIAHNSDLRAGYDQLLAAKSQLPKVQFNPSTDVLNRVLAYSAKTAGAACY
jgi:hypothetical protein